VAWHMPQPRVFGLPLLVVVVGFHCEVVSCELARRGVWRGAARASTPSPRSTAASASPVTMATDASLLIRARHSSRRSCVETERRVETVPTATLPARVRKGRRLTRVCA